VALRGVELEPCYDVVSHLVYAAGREHVSDVWIGGEAQLRDGRLLNDAFASLDKRLQLWQNALGGLAGH
jgi:5-methylthioadenosine/S-adenosylhomocysteine deaminase